MAREYTKEEVRELFLKQVKQSVDFWVTADVNKLRDRLDGVAFSIMNIIDGTSSLPSFILAPAPHEDDKESCIQDDVNWFPENNNTNVNCDIAGSLHELYHKV